MERRKRGEGGEGVELLAKQRDREYMYSLCVTSYWFQCWM